MIERKVPDKFKDLLIRVSEFVGSDKALEKATEQVTSKRSLDAIDRLKRLYKVLTLYGVEGYVSFDLGILSRFNYYTGVLFSAYTYGVGDAIAKGGRYDNLLGKYGKDAPSIGFSIVLDDLMNALYRQNEVVEKETPDTYVEYDENDFETALNKAKELRSKNINVVLKAKS